MGQLGEKSKEGRKALVTYIGEQLVEAIDEVKAEHSHEYSDSGTIDRIRESTISFVEDIRENDGPTLLKLVNKNPILDFSLGILGEHIIKNQEIVNNVFKKIGNDESGSLFDRGYTESFLMRTIDRARVSGVFGETSGVSYLLDKTINDLPFITRLVTSQSSKALMGQMFVATLGITPESIKEAYQTDSEGVRGILKHLASSISDSQMGGQLFEVGKLKVQEAVKGKIDLSELRLDEMATAARLYGLDGEKGLFNVVSASVLMNQRGLGGEIFSRYTGRFLQDEPEKTAKLFEEKYGPSKEKLVGDKLLEKIDKLRARGTADLRSLVVNLRNKERELKGTRNYLETAKKNPPGPLADEQLLAHIRENGIVGEKGLFAYMRDTTPEVLSQFQQAGIIRSDEVTDIGERYDAVSEITDMEELILGYGHLIKPIFKPRNERKGNLDIYLTERAEALDVTPYEFLTEKKFEGEKKELLRAHFPKSNFEEDMPVIVEGLDGVLNSEDFLEKLESDLSEGNNYPGVVKSAISYINFQIERNPSYLGTIRDYVRLVRDVSSTFVDTN